MLAAMKLYSPSEKATSCQLILQTTHTMLAASLKLCAIEHTQMQGVTWACFVIENTPMVCDSMRPLVDIS